MSDQIERLVQERLREGKNEAERLVRIEVTLENMHNRLFGNGQPGLCAERERALQEQKTLLNRAIGGLTVLVFLASFGSKIASMIWG